MFVLSELSGRNARFLAMETTYVQVNLAVESY